MDIFGLTISRKKAPGQTVPRDRRGAWRSIVGEPYTGAWQRNSELKIGDVSASHAVFACQTLIAGDIAKLRVKLVAQDSDGIWSETKNAAYSPVLRKPNAYQNRIQFFESWVLSKLRDGNAYALKARDNRNVVTALHLLSPDLVTPLVSDSGEVFYRLQTDKLSGIPDQLTVPAREIIHDRFNCLFHPLVGLSPIYANGLAAAQGMAIQSASTRLFQNGARPGGVLTAPGLVTDETASRLKEHWDNNFSGDNAGKVAVLGDGLKYEPMTVKATDAQQVEQLKWSAEMVASTYHVPAYKIGAGQLPAVNNIQNLNIEYYSQCLQVLIESIEICLDEGLGTGEGIGTEFDVDGLLRMDSSTLLDVLTKAKGTETLNETRRRIDRKRIEGGDTVYLQQQDHSLAAIAARDARLIAGDEPVQPPVPADAANDNAEAQAASLALFEKRLREALNV